MPEPLLPNLHCTSRTRAILSVLFVFVFLNPDPCIGTRFGSEGPYNNPAPRRCSTCRITYPNRMQGLRSPWPGIDQEIVIGTVASGFHSNWRYRSSFDCRLEVGPRGTVNCLNINVMRDGVLNGEIIFNQSPRFLHEPYPYLMNWGELSAEPLNVRGQCTLADGTTEPCLVAHYPYPFAFDSIITGVNRDLKPFNEMFICNNENKWHSMKREGQGFRMTYEWFRGINTFADFMSPFNVVEWYFLKTRNPNVLMTTRHGLRDELCMECLEASCPTDKQVVWNPEGTVDGQTLYWTHTSALLITCIRFTIKDTASCDLTKATMGDFNFEARKHFDPVSNTRLPIYATNDLYPYNTQIGPRNGEFVSFPAVFHLMINTTNVQDITHRANIAVPHVIRNCFPGYYAFRETAVVTSRVVSCEHPYLSCSERTIPEITTSCSDYDILLRCTQNEGAAFQSCVKSEVGYCQNQKRLSDSLTYWGSADAITLDACIPSNFECSNSAGPLFRNCDTADDTGPKPCIQDFLDLSTLRCEPVRRCGKFTEMGSYELSYPDPDFAYGSSYKGRCTCKTNIITDSGTISYALNANDQTETQCIMCSACGANQYVKQTCFLDWQMVDTLTVRKPMFVSVDTVCESCDVPCEVGQYSICQADRICMNCDCKGDCGSRFCPVNHTVCDGTRHENQRTILSAVQLGRMRIPNLKQLSWCTQSPR